MFGSAPRGRKSGWPGAATWLTFSLGNLQPDPFGHWTLPRALRQPESDPSRQESVMIRSFGFLAVCPR
jgi:hypothetical protein